jgi:deoxyribonuclease-4
MGITVDMTDRDELTDVIEQEGVTGTEQAGAAEQVITRAEFDPEDEYQPEPEPEVLPPHWMDGRLRFGIHTSISGGFVRALESAQKLGCTAVQFFSANPRAWNGGSARITEQTAYEFRARRAELGIGPVVIHANYLMNLAAQQPMLRTRSIQAFQEEMVRGMALEADFLVVHPGTCGDGTRRQAVSEVIDAVKQASKRLKSSELRVLIENSAGMGNSLAWSLEELGEIVGSLEGLNVGACVDTAHLFAAGYDIRSQSGLESTLQLIDRTVGLDRVPVFHANDSKMPLGSKVDRHEHIGEGKIGAAAFERLLQHEMLSANPAGGLPGRAFIAETPIDEPGDDRKNVAQLWNLAGLKDEAPEAEKGFSMLTAAAKKTAAKMHAAAQKNKKAAEKNKSR